MVYYFKPRYRTKSFSIPVTTGVSRRGYAYEDKRYPGVVKYDATTVPSATVATTVTHTISDIQRTHAAKGTIVVDVEDPRKFFKPVLSVKDSFFIRKNSDGLIYSGPNVKCPFADKSLCLWTTPLFFQTSGLYGIKAGGPGSLFTKEKLPVTLLSDEILREAFNKATLDTKLLFRSEAVSLGNILLELLKFKDMFKIASTHDLVEASNPFSGIGKTASGQWLGLNFGVIPFVSDLMNIISLIRNFDKFVDKWNEMAFRGKTLDSHQSLVIRRFDESTEYVNTFTATTTKTHRLGEEKVTAHVYFRPLPIDSRARAALSLSLWGLDKPLSFLWEAMPYSWLIDYFASIGDFLEALEYVPFLNIDIVDAGYTYKLKINDQKTAVSNGAYAGIKCGTTIREYDYFNRSAYTSPIVNVQVGNLKFDTDFTAKQGSYMFALAAGRLL